MRFENSGKVSGWALVQMARMSIECCAQFDADMKKMQRAER
jgi:hypothetical protein